MWRKQLSLDHLQDQGDIGALQEEKDRTVALLHQWGLCGESSCFQVYGYHHHEALTWSTISLKKAQQRSKLLRLLKRHHSFETLLVSVYPCSIKSIISYCLCPWFGELYNCGQKHSSGSLPLPRKSLASLPHLMITPRVPLPRETKEHFNKRILLWTLNIWTASIREKIQVS